MITFFHGDALAGIFSSDGEVVFAAADYLKAYAIDCLFTAIFFCYTGFYNGIGKDTICHDPGNPWRILRQSSGVLYYEHPAGNIAVSYRAGNADVVSLAVDSLRWIHALFEKKGMLDDKKI